MALIARRAATHNPAPSQVGTFILETVKEKTTLPHFTSQRQGEKGAGLLVLWQHLPAPQRPLGSLHIFPRQGKVTGASRCVTRRTRPEITLFFRAQAHVHFTSLSPRPVSLALGS